MHYKFPLQSLSCLMPVSPVLFLIFLPEWIPPWIFVCALAHHTISQLNLGLFFPYYFVICYFYFYLYTVFGLHAYLPSYTDSLFFFAFMLPNTWIVLLIPTNEICVGMFVCVYICLHAINPVSMCKWHVS